MTRVAIVGCGRQKLGGAEADWPVTISQLYTSNYFELKREFAETCCNRYYILSAKFGLVAPDRLAYAPYELSIDDLDEDELEVWSTDVRRKLHTFTRDTTLVLLAGRDYVDPLRGTLEFPAFSPDVEEPFEETAGIGEQMAWLREHIDEGYEPPPEGRTDAQSDLKGWSA